ICSFANAGATCVAGSCQLGACQSGYGNADGQASNGCECQITNGGVEICDGLDNDCNSLIDFTLVGGLPVSTCQCRDQTLRAAAAEPQCGQLATCATPQCSVTNGGEALGVSYTLGACVVPYPWAQCRFDSVDLNAFDADHGATGILEVSLCVVGPQPGETLNGVGLYYGKYPGRKRFAFFTEQELSQGISAGWYTRHFRPQNAACQPEPGIPSTCMSGCTNGQWGASNHPECVFSYDQTPLWVTV